MKPLVSVVMPVYNAKKYIHDSIESVLKQKYKNWELLLIVDGPTDGTKECLKDFTDLRIHVVENKRNYGIAYSRNKGIALASGKYIALLDDDDMAYPNRFLHQVEYLERHPEIGAVGGRTTFIDNEGNVLDIPNTVYYHPAENKVHLLFHNVLMNGAMMMRADLLKDRNLRYQDQCYGMEDFLFWVHFSKEFLIANLDEPVLYYRMHETNESAKVKENQLKQKLDKYASIQCQSIELSGFELTNDDKWVIKAVLTEIHTPDYSYEEYDCVFKLLLKLKKQCDEKNIIWRLEFYRMCDLIVEFIYKRTLFPDLNDYAKFIHNYFKNENSKDISNPYLVKQKNGLEFFLTKGMTGTFQSDAAVFIHLYYTDQKEKCFIYIRCACRICDVYITTSNILVADFLHQICQEERIKNCFVKVVENKGQDIAALVVHHIQDIKKYKYFSFVHDKKSPHIEAGSAAIWFDTLWENTIADEGYISQIIDIFKRYDNIGVLSVPSPFWDEFVSMIDNGWADVYEETNKLSKRIGMNYSITEDYPPLMLGTAFWARTSSLAKLWSAKFTLDDFPKTGVGKISYAIERIIPYVAFEQGYETGIVQTTEFAAYRINYLQGIISKGMNIVKNRFCIHDEKELTKISDSYIQCENLVKQFEYVYVYGTGVKATKCMNKFPRLLDYINGFLRTNGCLEGEKFFNKPIFKAKDVIKNNALFLIAMNKEDAEEVYQFLLRWGANPKNIVSILYFCDWLE